MKFDGTPIYQPGYGSMGDNPVADGSQFTVGVAWNTYHRLHDRQLVRQIVDRLVKAMEAVPRNPRTGLVHISDNGWDRCPYGFTDSVRKQGDVLFCSLLYVGASRQLADLLVVADRPADVRKWRAEASRVSESVRTVFWDASIGLFRAATVRCKEPDIWGSAFAVYLGVATREQSISVARYFKSHYDEIVYRGQIRHLPGGVYWEAACEKDRYQNGGFWATPTGWFVYTLDFVDPPLADRTVVDMVRELTKNGCQEWVFRDQKSVSNYVVSVALPIAGIRKMLQRREVSVCASAAVEMGRDFAADGPREPQPLGGTGADSRGQKGAERPAATLRQPARMLPRRPMMPALRLAAAAANLFDITRASRQVHCPGAPAETHRDASSGKRRLEVCF